MNTNVAPAAGAPDLLSDFLDRTRADMHITERAAPPPGDDPFEFVMSDNSVDRMGDVIEQNWVLSFFKRNPIALLNHDKNQIIGTWANVRVEGTRLLGRLNLAAEGTSTLIDTVRKLVAQKVLRAVSVGFRSLQRERLTPDDPNKFGLRFLKSELLECSLVAVPANANAVSTAKSMNVPHDVIAELFRKPAIEESVETRALTRKPAQSLALKSAKMLTRAQRIEAAQQSLVTMRDRLEALGDMESPNAEQVAEIADLNDKIPATAASLEQLEAIERNVGKGGATRTALVPSGGPRAIVVPRQRAAGNEREFLYKTAATLLVAKAKARSLDDVLRERYADEIDGAVIRAVTNPAATTVPAWAGVLSGTAVADFLNQLPRTAIYPVLRRLGASFTFGKNATINVPSRSATPKINGSFVGEGSPIPVRKAGLTSVPLTPKKMAVISTFTREMAEHSTPSIEGVIRQAMNEDTAEAIDQALIDATAADAIRPAGLLAGLTTQTPAATGTQFEKMVADINTLTAPIAAARGGSNLVLIMNVAQALKMAWAVAPNGTFVFSSVDNGVVRNLTIVASTTVAAGTLIMVDANEFATATGDTPEFDVSDVATLHEEDTTPLPIVGGATPPPTLAQIATPVRSLWQTASLGIRMILPMNWAMRRSGMVTFMTGVTW